MSGRKYEIFRFFFEKSAFYYMEKEFCHTLIIIWEHCDGLSAKQATALYSSYMLYVVYSI